MIYFLPQFLLAPSNNVRKYMQSDLLIAPVNQAGSTVEYN